MWGSLDEDVSVNKVAQDARRTFDLDVEEGLDDAVGDLADLVHGREDITVDFVGGPTPVRERGYQLLKPITP